MVDNVNPFSDPKYKYLYTDVIFLIGNGSSRKDFDLNKLRGKGTIIGCNALFRTFNPDILIAVDNKMVKEIGNSNYSINNICLSPAGRSNAPNFRSWKSPKPFNTSGAFAMHLIGLILKPKRLFCLGMDGYTGNVYAGTPNYPVRGATNFKGFHKHYHMGLESLEESEVFNVNSRNAWDIDCTNRNNYHTITYEDFNWVLELDKLLDFKIV